MLNSQASVVLNHESKLANIFFPNISLDGFSDFEPEAECTVKWLSTMCISPGGFEQCCIFVYLRRYSSNIACTDKASTQSYIRGLLSLQNFLEAKVQEGTALWVDVYSGQRQLGLHRCSNKPAPVGIQVLCLPCWQKLYAQFIDLMAI